MKIGNFPILFLTAVLALLFTVPVRGEDTSSKAMQDEIEALKQMVLDLQKRIQHLESERGKPQRAVSSLPNPPTEKKKSEKSAKKAARTHRTKNVSDPLPSSGFEKTAQAKAMSQEIGAKPPAPLELAGHEVRVGISGAVQADVIHDFNALGLSPGDGVAREYITAYIPVGGPAADITNRTAFSPNQSYLTGWAETDTPWGPFKVYADVNLMGSTTDAQFQVYKVYGEWGWLKAGLDYSLWLNQAAIPSTLDFEGPNAVPENRFTQASLKIPLRPGTRKREFFLTIGVEDAQGDMTLPSGVANISTVEQVPSIVGKLSYEPGWTQMELAGLYRRLKAEGDGYDQTVNGWGVSFSGSIDTYGNDSFVWGVEYGEALGAYIQDTSGLGLDAAPVSAANSDLRAIPAFGLWAGYQHWWNKASAVIGHLWAGESG